MVNFSRLSTLPLVALGVLTSQVSAAPVAGEAAEVTTTFSFAEWVDSIIADPSTALSPKEAVQAYLDTANATLPATAGVEKRGWDAQVVCRSGKSRAPVSSAAFAINFLAAAGQVACPGRMIENGIWPQRIWINWNGALLLPFDHDNDPRNYPTCQGLAQMYGVIMDTCTTPDGLVGGSRAKDLTGTKHGGVLGHTTHSF
ncbi:hypothetical protein SMAC4_13866 [Sordaria macrospora]|uniref:uncharacterized protein n=1 Tax=Sordaria macrospora TaxID=5147 RepID=UPI002B2DF6C9|nr:hypothetical protein SMAC4_13866 [Sordaria macrospora]